MLYFANAFCRLEERLAQRKAKLAEMKKSQEEELSKNDPEKQENLAKEQVNVPSKKSCSCLKIFLRCTHEQ